jgi:hypothetical protein
MPVAISIREGIDKRFWQRYNQSNYREEGNYGSTLYDWD